MTSPHKYEDQQTGCTSNKSIASLLVFTFMATYYMYCATLCEEWQSAENTVSHEVIMYICAELHVTRYEDRHTSKSLHFLRRAIPQNYDNCENNRKQVKEYRI